MKYSYVHNYKYIPLWDTGIVFNKTDSGYYEKFVVGLAKSKDNDLFLIPVIQSCGNGCGDNRLLLEDDDTVDKEYYLDFIKWINNKIVELDNNQAMFIELIEELGILSEWISDEYDKAKELEDE